MAIHPIQEINPGPTIGQAFGKGLVNTYEPYLQRELARHQTQRAIGDIKARSAGANPQDLLFNLIEASTISPEIGRNLGPLYETLMRGQNTANAPGAIESALGSYGGLSSEGTLNPNVASQGTTPKAGFAPNTQFTPEKTAEAIQAEKTGEQLQNLSTKYLEQTRPDLFQPNSMFGNIPTFDIMSKSALRPEEEAKIRKDLNSQGYSPEQQENVVAKINEDIGNRYKEALKNYDIAQGQQGAIDKKWETIKDDSDVQLKPWISKYGPAGQQFLKDRYFQYAESQSVYDTPERIEQKAMELLQKDMMQMDAIENLPAIPPFRQWKGTEESMNSLKKAYEPLKKAGMHRVLLEDAINNKDAGIEEAHDLVYGDQTNKELLNSIHSVKMTGDRNKYVNDVAEKLKNLGPDDDLMLTRAMVLGNGGTIEDFNNALVKAGTEGLELSPFQISQLQEIQTPRIRPMWEIFSEAEKEPQIGYAGMLTPYVNATFKHFINYVRGKK